MEPSFFVCLVYAYYKPNENISIIADENEVKQFFCQFKNIFRALMADLHTWFSVSNKPDHSRFTRVQRATCCLTCVYLYMSVNAVWYGLFKSPSEVNAPLSWNSFGWEEIIVALISTIMVVPFWVGLTLIFKKSRCKVGCLCLSLL